MRFSKMRWFFSPKTGNEPERLYEFITLRRERFCVHAICRVVKVTPELLRSGLNAQWTGRIIFCAAINKENVR